MRALIVLHFRLPSRTLIAMQDQTNFRCTLKRRLVQGHLRRPKSANGCLELKEYVIQPSELLSFRSAHNMSLEQLLLPDYLGCAGSQAMAKCHSRIEEFEALLENL